MTMATARRTVTRDRAAPSAITAARRSVDEAVDQMDRTGYGYKSGTTDTNGRRQT